jgi:hypothetical protein
LGVGSPLPLSPFGRWRWSPPDCVPWVEMDGLSHPCPSSKEQRCPWAEWEGGGSAGPPRALGVRVGCCDTGVTAGGRPRAARTAEASGAERSGAERAVRPGRGHTGGTGDTGDTGGRNAEPARGLSPGMAQGRRRRAACAGP